jgi:VanZ family protein
VSGGSPLVRILLAVDVLLTVYASLYPLEGWRGHGLSPLAYLGMGWPPYRIPFDIAVNVLGYAPYGMLCVAALHPRLRGVGAFAIAILSAMALAVALEGAQSYLPARTPSLLDVVCNAGGAAVGALLGLRLAPWLLDAGPLQRLRAAGFLPGAGVDFGLVLIALWLFIQLNPATLLFGAGDLRDLVGPHEGRGRSPEFFVLIEAVTAAANLVSVALLLSALTAPGKPVRAMLLALVAIALVVRAAAYVILMRAELLLAWFTPGAQLGLAAGLVIAAAAVALPRTARLALAAVLILAATVLVNLAPPNPYFAASLKLWRQGHFLNFNGLTRLVAAVWPFVALGYLIFLASRRAREPQG